MKSETLIEKKNILNSRAPRLKNNIANRFPNSSLFNILEEFLLFPNLIKLASQEKSRASWMLEVQGET